MKYKVFFSMFVMFFLQKNIIAQNDFFIVKNKGRIDSVFLKTDKNILYNTGNQAFMDSLADVLVYPAMARLNQERAKFNFAFVVSKNGLAKDPYSIDSLNSNFLVRESLKKLNFFLKNHRLDWQIATNKGRNVNAVFPLSISFLAEKTEKSAESTFVASSKDTIVVSCCNNAFFSRKIITIKDSLIGEIYDNTKVDVGAVVGNEPKDILHWFNASVVYPALAREKNIKGRVFVRFEIDENGILSNPIITSNTAEILNQEVLRLISIMPKWKPAKHHGRNVKVFITMPVSFKLEG